MPGPLRGLRRQDRVSGAERGGQGGHPGQAQRAQEARGQGGGDGRHQRAPAGGSQHEEDGEKTFQFSVIFDWILCTKVWSTELEAIAQRWADQCTFGHDSTRDKLDGTSVGFTHHHHHQCGF